MMQAIVRFLMAVARPVRRQWLLALAAAALLAQQVLQWMTVMSGYPVWQLGKLAKGLLVLAGVVWLQTWLAARWRVARWLLLALDFALFAITMFLDQNFGMSISQQTLTALVETTPQESREFLATYLPGGESMVSYLIDLAALAALVLLATFRRRLTAAARPVLGRPWVQAAVGAVLLAGVGCCLVCQVWLWSCTNSTRLYRWRRQYPHESCDIFTQACHAVASLRAYANDVTLARRQAQAVAATQPTLSASGDSVTVVMVLGESYNRHHASLYGYPLPTTPVMQHEQAQGRLWAFTNAVTPHNTTSIVEKNVLSVNSLADGEPWFSRPMFTTVFRQAGYDVFLWDMQRDYSKQRLFTITVNQLVYDPVISRLSYTAINPSTPRYDLDLIEDFAHNVHFTRPHNLVVFHLMGQHASAGNRYPAGSPWSRTFTARDYGWRHEPWLTPAKRRDIAHYDNATRYNDAVMGRIFSLLRSRNAVVVYFADHGEEVWDCGDFKGRRNMPVPDSLMLVNQNLVPLVVWCSPTFARLHPGVVKRLQGSTARPVMVTDVAHLLFTLGGVRTAFYKPARDFISPQWRPAPRPVYDRVDYDRVVRP